MDSFVWNCIYVKIWWRLMLIWQVRRPCLLGGNTVLVALTYVGGVCMCVSVSVCMYLLVLRCIHIDIYVCVYLSAAPLCIYFSSNLWPAPCCLPYWMNTPALVVWAVWDLRGNFTWNASMCLKWVVVFFCIFMSFFIQYLFRNCVTNWSCTYDWFLNSFHLLLCL